MLNSSIIQGRLVKDPELEMCGANNDIPRLRLTVACERSFVTKGRERKTDFIDCVAWRQTAEHIAKYFSKGSLILVEGSIHTDTVENKEGQKRKYTQLTVDSVNFCGSKKDNAGGQSEAPATPAAPAATGGDPNEGDIIIDDDEDLPF